MHSDIVNKVQTYAYSSVCKITKASMTPDAAGLILSRPIRPSRMALHPSPSINMDDKL